MDIMLKKRYFDGRYFDFQREKMFILFWDHGSC